MSAAAATAEPQYATLTVGDPAPWFHQRCTSNANYAFDTAAGRYIVLCFFASAAEPLARAALDAVSKHRHLFDDERACFFGVSLDPADESTARVRENLPGIRYFWDHDGAVSRLYGCIPKDCVLPQASLRAKLFWLVLDPTLRIMKTLPLPAIDELVGYLNRLPPPDRFAGFEVPPPILVLPNVFEPALCEQLIRIYETDGGEESGFMRDVGGKTVPVMDANHKRRKDCIIQDAGVIRHIQSRILRRINPELVKIYAFNATRMERYIVACYAAEDGGHFRAHRDNTTKGTAHRRFAVSINLNSDFEGGEISFPEYGRRAYKPPLGGAVVFPCVLLHAVSKVTAKRRYAFLPFLYDDAAAKIREANHRFLSSRTDEYRA